MLLNKILDFIFPPKCPFCGDIITKKIPVCDNCMISLPFVEGDACLCCGRPLEEFSHELCSQCKSEKRYFEHSFVPLLYEEHSKDAVLGLKHSYHPYYAKGIAFLIADKMLSSPFYTEFDYITCVPESGKSEKKRGYNHAELIAKELSKLLDVPYINTLIRTNDGARQATLNREERKKNVRKCYFPGKEVYSSGTILLVDDVYTTGETTNYCAKLLRKAGFEKVYLGVATIRCED